VVIPGGGIDPYATHLEALIGTAMSTDGPILELGRGDYSTPLLKAIAKAQGREFKSQASNKEWASRFQDVEIVDWDTWVPPLGYWGMVFLDSEEHTHKRYERLHVLSTITNTIVLHDANEPKRYDVLNGWGITLHVRHKPHTAVFRRV
jgi:hypothetical protein